MCNRYSSTRNDAELQLRGASLQLVLTPRYNIAPTQEAPIVVMEGGQLQRQDLIWGWKGPHGPITNARAETAENKHFRRAWITGRCLIPADGFFEWKTTPEGKQPYWFARRDRKLFWFAGLWEEGRFAILTGPAQGCVSALHDRMPIILEAAGMERWLNTDEMTSGSELFEAAGTMNDFSCHPVSRAVSRADYTAPDAIAPITVAQQEFSLFD